MAELIRALYLDPVAEPENVIPEALIIDCPWARAKLIEKAGVPVKVTVIPGKTLMTEFVADER